MAGIVSLEKNKVDSLKMKSEPAQSDKEKTESGIDSTKEKNLLKHKQILSYYKKHYRALPRDLSPYEKRVGSGGNQGRNGSEVLYCAVGVR